MNDIKALKALKNKILSLAMQGTLLKQNENDEPASVLLEKIRLEKNRLKENNVNAVLIGETLMKSPDKKVMIRELKNG